MIKRNKLIILLCVLVVVTAAYVVLNKTSQNSAAKNAKTLEVTNFDPGKIVKITLASSSQTINIERDKTSGNWKLVNSPKTALEYSIISNILNTMAKLNANRIIDNNPSNTSSYGLNPPTVTATAVLADGSQKVFYLGDMTPDGSDYYLMLKGNPKLYTISSNDGSHLSYNLNDIEGSNS